MNDIELIKTQLKRFISVDKFAEYQHLQPAVENSTENDKKLINDEILQNQRADYGKQVVYSLSKKLTEQFGGGWSEQHLRHCLRSAETIELDAH